MKDVKAIIDQNAVVVFSKSYCPYCIRVKQLLTKLKAVFKAIELDHDPEGAAMQAALAQMTGQRTVPNVFIAQQQIGGCDNTESLHRQGKLVPLLEAAGAISV
eukprot:TRINITY_DN19187_c0_g1_i1.p2 TRINITY_DN19187_c0_g1~~TRINITY_DN19187_c0_g1_i1.p2  ORF type:complete len:103 (+),score=16.29 TRINITY_DN19187_c0_g1_i1:95-403(+)